MSSSTTTDDDPFYCALSLLKELIKKQCDATESSTKTGSGGIEDLNKSMDDHSTNAELKDELEYYGNSLESERKQRESLEKALEELSVNLKLLQNQRNQLESQLKKRYEPWIESESRLADYDKLCREHESTKRELQQLRKDLAETKLKVSIPSSDGNTSGKCHPNESTSNDTPTNVAQVELLALRNECSQLKTSLEEANLKFDEHKRKLTLTESNFDPSNAIDAESGKGPIGAASLLESNMSYVSDRERLHKDIEVLRCALRRALSDARHSQILLESYDDRLCGRECNYDIFKMMSDNDVEKINGEINHIRHKKSNKRMMSKQLPTDHESHDLKTATNDDEKCLDQPRLLELNEILVTVLQQKIKKLEAERSESGKNTEHLLLELEQKNEEIQSLKERLIMFEMRFEGDLESNCVEERVASVDGSNVDNQKGLEIEREGSHYANNINQQDHVDPVIGNDTHDLSSGAVEEQSKHVDDKDEPTLKRQKKECDTKS